MPQNLSTTKIIRISVSLTLSYVLLTCYLAPLALAFNKVSHRKPAASHVVNVCTPNPVVTSTADSGAGTLREALANVCTGDTITFNLAGAGPHTITLTTGELLVVDDVTINNNSGESITVSGNNTSRVFSINNNKTANIIGLSITGGSVTGDGAGILNDGALTIVNSTLFDNTAGADGGAINTTATSTSLTLINTTISGNTAGGSGGGLITQGGTVSIVNTTITNNTADLDNNGMGDGGGINSHGTVLLKNTIVFGNFNEDGNPDTADDISGIVDATSSFNLIGIGGPRGLTDGINNNQVGVTNAGLGPLADNGGTTQTHALLSTSPAVETGSNANLPTDTFDLDGDANTAESLPVDQRGMGFPRIADSADANIIQTVDIGAFELHPSLEDIPNQTTNEDTVKNVSFNIGDDTGSLIASVTVTSSNTTLVPNANMSITGSGGSRMLQITPAANLSGTTTITVTVTATNGRTATDTFVLTVTAINDPPAGTDNTVNTSEDTPYTFTAADFGFTDPNDTPPNTLLAVKIITLPASGTLTNNNVPLNAGDFIPIANINGGLLKFTPVPDGNGSPYTSFTFQVQDNGGSTDLDPTPNTMSINVTGLNDGPVNSVPGPQFANQNTPLIFSSGNGNQISVADADTGANAIQVTLTASNGTLTLISTLGLSFTVGDGTADATMTFAGTIANINTALNGMTFTPASGFSGAASLTITTNDQGNSGAGGPLVDSDVVNIQVSTNISVQDAQVVEPGSGTANMIFTVTLSAPAPATGASVSFTTVQEPPAVNHATAGSDYTTTSGTITFAPGEQLKPISVPVLMDGNTSESNETFQVVLSSPVNGAIVDGTATGTILIANQPGTILITELRTSGPAGAGDDFVEIYNNSDSPHTVNGTSGGYGLFKIGADCNATPVLIGTIPNGAIIPARGHYLFVGSAYNLNAYATGDQTLSSDIENDRNVAIFSTTSLVSISSVNRLDAVGFGSNTGATCNLFHEGNRLTPLSGSALEYSYVRDECGKNGNPNNLGLCPIPGLTPRDSNVNVDDFFFVETTATATPAGQRLGAPGPQNLSSHRSTTNISMLLLDATKSATVAPNRVRDLTPVPNGSLGTLSTRRRLVNNTGSSVTKLRFRVIDISTFPVSGGIADVRTLSSVAVTGVTINDSTTCASTGTPSTAPCTVTVQGTTLEQPPGQTIGGGFNSTVAVGTITLSTPLAAGASVNVQFMLGVQQNGSFKFLVNMEALP